MKKEETALGARISKELKEELTHYCNANGLVMSFFVKQAIEEKLRRIAAENAHVTHVQKIDGEFPVDDGQNINSVGVDPCVDPPYNGRTHGSAPTNPK